VSRGILDFVGLAVTVAFAAPLAYAGANMLLDGRTILGGALLLLAVLMIVVEEYVVTPGDLPGLVAQKATGKVAVDEETEES
jgi:hypothetical protein